MIGWSNIETKTVARATLILTFLLLAVSLASLLFQWNLANGYSVEIFILPLLFEYTPLGLVILNKIVYFTNPTLKLIMDLLYLVPYTLAILVTGQITVFSYPLSKIAGCEKFGETKNRIRSIITQGVKRKKRGVNGIVLIIIVSYALELLIYFVGYTAMPAGGLLEVTYPLVYGIIGLGFAYSIMESVGRKIKTKCITRQC